MSVTVCLHDKYRCCTQCPSLPWQQQIWKKKKQAWLKIPKEATRNTNVSAFALRPFECQMCGARRHGVRTLLSSSQLIFIFFPPIAEPRWEAHIQLCYCTGDEAHNASLFAFCCCTLKWLWPECLSRHEGWRSLVRPSLVLTRPSCFISLVKKV